MQGYEGVSLPGRKPARARKGEGWRSCLVAVCGHHERQSARARKGEGWWCFRSFVFFLCAGGWVGGHVALIATAPEHLCRHH